MEGDFYGNATYGSSHMKLSLGRLAYSHDAPDLGGAGSNAGYAIETGGSPVGYPN